MPRRPGSRPTRPLRPDELPAVRLRSAFTEETVAAGLRSGELVRVRRGAYMSAVDLSTDPFRRATELALARVLAVVQNCSVPVVVSHLSAAMLHGLALVQPPNRVHLTQGSYPQAQHDSDVFRHCARLDEDEVTTVAGIRVTSLARTTLDCVRMLRGPSALVVADAALRAGLHADAIADALHRAAGGRGVRHAREVLPFADDGAESPRESYTRAVLLGLGLPVPETQVRVDTVDGPFWVDLGWRQWRLLTEYDGRLKYGGTTGDRSALVREKRREDLVRDEGWRILRITSRDTSNPTSLRSRLSRVLPEGALSTLTPRPVFTAPDRELVGYRRTRGA